MDTINKKHENESNEAHLKYLSQLLASVTNAIKRRRTPDSNDLVIKEKIERSIKHYKEN